MNEIQVVSSAGPGLSQKKAACVKDLHERYHAFGSAGVRDDVGMIAGDFAQRKKVK